MAYSVCVLFYAQRIFSIASGYETRFQERNSDL
jgi:hypothetical protein